ncbi:hypothetical protein A7985_10295 [Pseudoalteromonas luteoviolacea]|uniref:Lipoprotein n=1 Tax=Pseudoalteromonas luteoviolacea TaxID=43657 RepID=A0A1C0TSD5_9GAMM|nr:hypothetical protein [Pseudoalteromonas luteoviolacea]MBQ4810829.1 hypothetical protein [Pseudoalteromonas luteoviolacea]OCQ22169.1 hypothetical protein A7985_10295 [Pseudoalteromonas luteoviolacea]
MRHKIHVINNKKVLAQFSSVAFGVLALSACSSINLTSHEIASQHVTAQCRGQIEQHAELQLLPNAQIPQGVVQPVGKGGLCKAQVFIAKEDITIWRAWNSEYSGSKLGKWWTFNKPLGSISKYRRENVICPSYSPLDMLVSCKLKAGTQVVIGPGQSAQCSEYFTYPASKTNQIYVADATNVVSECQTYDGRFSWQTEPTQKVQATDSQLQ